MRDGWTPNSDPGASAPWPAASRPPLPPAARDGIWRPEAGAGFLIGGVLLAISIVIALVALRQALIAPGVMTPVWLLVAAAAVAGAVLAASALLRLRSLRYILGPDALIVQRRGLRFAIPYHAIDAVVLRPRDRIEIAGYERYWPGYYDGMVATSEGPWRVLATTPANRRVRIHWDNHPVLAISPERPVLFVEALERRRRLAGQRRSVAVEPPAPEDVSHAPVDVHDAPVDVPGDVQPPEPLAAAESRRQRSTEIPRPEFPAWLGKPVAWRIFRERIVRGDPMASNLLALCLIALIVLVTITAWRADAVNTPLPVRWNAEGEPVAWVRAHGFWIFEGVWIFPATAAAVIAINAALATFAVYLERLREARMLLAAALPVELVLMAALWRAAR